ncbi:type II secretion system protein GspM [[Enterobacter] lignolyticus]|uniref:General secretion pathway M protein n=1 Tax=Enterobacter lignolyticus (strain SCF1) TaxID=701347 RepID=E3G241_ENTLS|nr:type II secretion system protein M [[Enterobacter] lignolyticus]ADO49175.1 General secretion pathway M protein [[Enterobacter] lignolyticus SCF1]
MNAQIMKLDARWQAMSVRERGLALLCALAIGLAALWYGVWQPLAAINRNSQQTIERQLETIRWMRSEITRMHIPVRQTITENVRTVVEDSASELQIPLSQVQQQGKTLSFSVTQVDFAVLKNWMREVNLASGARIEKITLTPVDRRQQVSAEVLLSWGTP